MSNARLPDKPSRLLRLALTDYFIIKENPEYRINLNKWHVPDAVEPFCNVCLAGSVMANTLQTNRLRATNPTYYDSDTFKQLIAIDYFRTGQLLEALSYLEVNNEKFSPTFYNGDEFVEFEKSIINYQDPELFEAYIQDLIGILEAEGL